MNVHFSAGFVRSGDDSGELVNICCPKVPERCYRSNSVAINNVAEKEELLNFCATNALSAANVQNKAPLTRNFLLPECPKVPERVRPGACPCPNPRSL